MPFDGMLRQISLSSPSLQDGEMYGDEGYVKELKKFRASLCKSSQAWPNGYDLAASPLPILIPQTLNNHLEKLADILNRVTSNIVGRWFDPQETFTKRMPLLPHQEDLLRWMDGPGRSLIKPFAARKSAWRPDFLLKAQNDYSSTKDEDLDFAEEVKTVQICEINARFAFNGFFLTAFQHEAFDRKTLEQCGLETPVDPENIFEGFKSMLDLKKTVHVLKGEEHGYDVFLFQAYLRDRCGIEVRFIKPEDLLLVDEKLCCKTNSEATGCKGKGDCVFVSKNGKVVEQIYQVALELHQRELENLDENILKAIAPICFNDLRTIYLVHDKRMLGIILEELRSISVLARTEDDLERGCTSLAHILSAEEAELLTNAIVPTFIPGSKEIQKLIRDTQAGIEKKDSFLMKPIGSGKGAGIIFGSDVTAEGWMKYLERLSDTRVEGTIYVVQPVVHQAKFEVIIPEKESRSALQYNHFVGTIMMTNGRYLGPGIWRTSPHRICAISRGGASACSLMKRSKTIQATSTNNGNHLILKNVARIAVSTLDEAQNALHINAINAALHQNGILILDLDFDDPASLYLSDLIKSLQTHFGHGQPLTHSATRGAYWEVRPDPVRMAELSSPRSETMEDFPWHTDCSYDSNPPNYFALQVIQADRYGGGTLSVLESQKVMDSLSSAALEALCAPEFLIKVPPEFQKGIDTVTGRLLGTRNSSSAKPQLRFRFRADIVEALTPRAQNALVELKKVLAAAKERKSCIDLSADILPNRSIVLLDNHRWLHSRNVVKDRERHLRRIRWDSTEF